MPKGKLSQINWELETNPPLTTLESLTKKLDQLFQTPKEETSPTLKTLDSLLQKEIPLSSVKLKSFKAFLKSSSRLIIYGDYDADGITSSYLLASLVRQLQPQLEVQIFLPHRQEDGYGINASTISKLQHRLSFDSLTTVDNGVNNLPLLRQLKESGLKVALIDHHSLKKHSLQFTDFFLHQTTTSAAGLVFALIFAFYKEGQLSDKLFSELLQIATIGVLADQMPLQGANFVLAKLGLNSFNTQGVLNQGIRYLLKQASWQKEYLDEYVLNYIIIPRLNASGRLGSANLALKLLSTRNSTQLESLSLEIEKLNRQRQTLTAEYLKDEAQKPERLGNFLFLYQTDIPEGIIGLIAGQLSQKYQLPAIVVTGNEELKGSVRSPASFHLTETLRHFEELFLSLGGHQKAAGFSLQKKKLAELKEALKKEKFPLTLTKKVAHLISPTLIQEKLVYLTNKYRPFGVDRPKPYFYLEDIEAEKIQPLGQGNKHFKIFSKNNHSLPFIVFNLPSHISPSSIKRCIFSAEINHFRQQEYPQLQIIDIL